MHFRWSHNTIFKIIERKKTFAKLNKIGELVFALSIFQIRVIEKSGSRATSGDRQVQPSVGSSEQ